MSVLVPSPFASSARSGRILAPGATPSMPMPLPASAAVIPVTCVPCPLSSWGVESPSTKSWPPRSRPARSGWAASTPVSITATVAPAPLETWCAASASIMSRPHCCERSGSPAPAAGAAAISAPARRVATTAGNRRIGRPSVRPAPVLRFRLCVAYRGYANRRGEGAVGRPPGSHGRDLVPALLLHVAVLEHEDLEAHVGIEDHLAVVGEDAPAGGALHGGLELLLQDLLEGQPGLAHEVRLAGLDERLLRGREQVLEHAEDVVVEQVRLRLRGPTAIVRAEEVDDRIRDLRSLRTDRGRVLPRAHGKHAIG